MDPHGRRELVDMAVALLALSAGFSILAAKGPGVVTARDLARAAAFFPYILVVMAFAFLGHELAHRQMARRLGYLAWFEADYRFLPLVIILPLFFNFIFAAPGATVIAPFRLYGASNERRDILFISLVGPLSNIAFSLVGLAVLLAHPTGLLGFWAAYFGAINAWLAFFNLLPIPPLDGYKAVRSSVAWWAAFMAFAGVLVYIFGPYIFGTA